MSQYTTQVLQLVYGLTADMPLSPLSERIEKARQQIFDFEYPIWHPDHKKELEKKIIYHFLNWEIGLETYPLWKIYLEGRMNEIMPYYVELYNSIYPFKDKLYYNQDVTETYSETSTDDYTDKYDGTIQNDGDIDYTRSNDISSNSNNLSTTNLKDSTTSEQTVSETKNITGNKIVDDLRTDDLSEDTTNITTTGNTKTNNLTEKVDTNTTNDNTKTNDLTESVTGDKDITNTRTDNLSEKIISDRDLSENSKTDVAGHSLQVVSDLPQSNLGGTSLLAGVPDIYKTDYASQSTQNENTTSTTVTNNLQENTTSTKTNAGTVQDIGKETSTNTTSNTGTVKDSSKGTLDTTTTNTGTVTDKGNTDTSILKLNTGTVKTDGKEDTKEDTTFSHTQNLQDDVTHTGSVNVDGTSSSKQSVTDHTKDVNLRTDKNQRIMDRDGTKTYRDNKLGISGMKTYSELIAQYIPEIKNIDMLIINDLTSLFMNIF